MTSKLKSLSGGAIYKDVLSRLRMGIETSGRDFIMHDAGLIVTVQAFGKHAAHINEPDELPFRYAIRALCKRAALYRDGAGRGYFESDPSCEPFFVLTHDTVGIWPDEELPEGMLDARGIPLEQIVIRNVTLKRECAR